jgi:hypothetical protein
MKPLMSIAAVAGVLMLAASCKNNEPVDLKLNLKPGSQYAYTIQTNTTTEQKPMGQSISSTQHVTMEMTYAVGEAEGANQRLSVTYDRLAMDMSSPMGTLSYDSRDSAKSDPRLAVVGGMLNKPFTMTVTPEGEIKSVEGLDAILRSIGDSTTEEGLAVQQQMAATFNDTAVRSLMRQSLDIFPGHPVKPGDTWTKTYKMNMNVMQMTVDNVFTLKSVEGGTAHVDVKAKIQGEGTTDLPELKNMHIALKGEQTGTMDIDVASGLVTDGNVSWHITGDMSVMGMKVPMSIDSKVKMTARKK